MFGPRIATLAATAVLAGAGFFGAAAPVVAATLGTTAPQSRVEATETPSGSVTGALAPADVTWGP